MTKKSNLEGKVPAEFMPKDNAGEEPRIDPKSAPEIDRPGIYTLTDEQYHNGTGVSRSTLWALHSKTPLHARYGVHKQTDSQKLGEAIHTAILEPHAFERKYSLGPDAHGSSKEWKAAVEIASAAGKVCLKPDAWSDALYARDAVLSHPTVRKLVTTGAPAVEQSAYAIDEATGELVRVRPDLYSPDFSIMVDLKSTASARSFEFGKSVAEYGYHLQRAMYPMIWEEAKGGRVDAYVFICVEPKRPHAVALFELQEPEVKEGIAVYRQALDSYHRSMQLERTARHENEIRKNQGKEHMPDDVLERHIRAKCWPGYTAKVQPLTMPSWGYTLTPPPA